MMNNDRDQLPLLRLREPGRDGGVRQDGQARRLSGGRSTELYRLAYRYEGETRERLTFIVITIFPLSFFFPPFPVPRLFPPLSFLLEGLFPG